MKKVELGYIQLVREAQIEVEKSCYNEEMKRTRKERLISVIATCYNEQDNLVELHRRVGDVFNNLHDFDYELILVDNDSTDKSLAIYQKLVKIDQRVKIVVLSRNFGSPQPSFIAGLEQATGEAAVLLHGDIQDPPELIPKFIEKWQMGWMVVYGVRTSRRGYGKLMNWVYRAFYELLKKLAYIEIPLNAGEFSLMDARVVKELLKIDEYDYYLRCLRAYVGFPQIGIEYVREARTKGKSTESIRSGLWWAKTIIVNFSFKPLAWISTLALLTVSASFLAIIVFLISYYFSPSSPRGIPTLFVLILFLGGIQLLSLSVIAEYIAKIFLEVKHRPKYIIKQIIGGKNEK